MWWHDSSRIPSAVTGWLWSKKLEAMIIEKYSEEVKCKNRYGNCGDSVRGYRVKEKLSFVLMRERNRYSL